jgi:endonuclease G
MPSTRSQAQSFTLANIIPQTANLNRRAWRSIESKIRYAAYGSGSAYVVTGPLFIGSRLDTLRGRVFVPSHVWKAVHIPGRGSIVYVATNQRTPTINAMTISQFSRQYAINPFPALSGRYRDQLLTLR